MLPPQFGLAHTDIHALGIEREGGRRTADGGKKGRQGRARRSGEGETREKTALPLDAAAAVRIRRNVK